MFERKALQASILYIFAACKWTLVTLKKPAPQTPEIKIRLLSQIRENL